MLTDIPKYIDGAKTLYISKSNITFNNVIINDIQTSIEYIVVCQYKDDSGFYLFGCDKNFNTQTDFFYDSIDEALEDAKRLYQVQNIQWI
ncbi:hypothetical protein [Mucilaginibacter arboris]|uniref:Uncharacterized protein n=1 Tax=Mucilaginibacter arboris TaxID=2682090 RepID=A0A7K1T1N4_9SPHI|nr:hypothetical protein [Mucilaginibacter arboris]MVN23496.1 hypothetical protein [Mucilaginibacter arboris]